MILPKTELYNTKSDAEFRIKMIQHIKSAYKDILGDDIKLLDHPNGLEMLQAKVQKQLYTMTHGEIDITTVDTHRRNRSLTKQDKLAA